MGGFITYTYKLGNSFVQAEEITVSVKVEAFMATNLLVVLSISRTRGKYRSSFISTT